MSPPKRRRLRSDDLRCDFIESYLWALMDDRFIEAAGRGEKELMTALQKRALRETCKKFGVYYTHALGILALWQRQQL